MCAERHRQQHGFTLIELVMFIVIVGVGLAGVLGALNITVKSSADPLAPKQALAIAEGVLEEITLKAFAHIATATRTDYDDVEDYDAVGGGATALDTDAVGNAWPSGYSVTVAVADTNIGPAGNTVAAKAVTVAVAYSGGSVSLVGYRGNY